MVLLFVTVATIKMLDIDLEDFVEAEQHMYTLPLPAPPIRLGEERFLEDPAISTADHQLISQVYSGFDKITLETCSICNRTWFNLNVHRNRQRVAECYDCRDDRVKFQDSPEFVPLLGASNDMDPGPLPAHLP